jgi:putative ABC transport system permease protein
MADATDITRFRFCFWLIRAIGVIVPRKLRADWQQEWEAELCYREMLLSQWDKLDWLTKLDLLWRSLGAFWDALLLQPQRLEDEMFQDLRFAVRMLIKQPLFTLIAVFTLALGIGANTAIFSVVNAVLLRPLPYSEPERLLTTRYNQSALDVADTKAQTQAFSDIGGIVVQALDYTDSGEPVQVQTGMVTGGYFNTLGIQPVLGRSISYEEDKQGGERVIVLSYSFWQKHFGGEKNVLGEAISLSGNSYTIIGVMPADFKSPRENPEIWAPVQVANPLAAQARGVHFLSTYCRLQKDVTAEQAAAEMTIIDEWLATHYPEENKNRRTLLLPLQERVVGGVRSTLFILFGAVSLVLLIACANFANLMLTRAASRQQELIIRTALGAGRGRLVRQLLTESALLAFLGGIAGLFLAWGGLNLLVALKPANLPRLDSISLDWRVLLFTLGLSLFTGLLFGLIPALNASKPNLNEALKEGGRSSTAGGRRNRLRNILVVSELALALVLLIGAGLLIKSLFLLRDVKTGFNSENLLTMRLELPEARYKEIAKQIQFRNSVIESVNSLPGVQTAMISELPLSGNRLNHNFVIDGRPPMAPGSEPDIETRSISHDYFKTMGIPLRNGRDFTAQDRQGTTFVGVINESAVHEFFPDENPIGARLRWARGSKDAWITIVGVVGDIKHYGLGLPEQSAVYTLYEQQDQPWKRWMYLTVRTQSDTAALTNAVKEKIRSIDNQLPASQVRLMNEVMAESLATQRFNMFLLGIFAMVALLLAVVGIYGVISYSVSQRTHELGIRLALGAQTRDVLSLILIQGLKLAVTGVALGLIAAFAVTRVMETLLFGVSATDPLTFAGIALLLASVALLACFFPARRAAKTDPIIALRYE